MTKVNEVLKKRIDIHTSSPNNGLLEFQSAVHSGYVIDITNRGGVTRRGLHIFLELIKATPLEVTPVVEEVAVEEVAVEEVAVEAPKEIPAPTTPRRNTAKKPTTEDTKEDVK